jgi:hypothetical protein
MSIETDLDDLFMTKAAAVATALSLPLSVPNRVFEKPETGRYLRVQHFPNRNTGIDWNDKTMFQGIVQFDIFVEPNIGSIPARTIADTIIAAFWGSNDVLWAGSTMIKIEEKPSVLSQVDGGQETFVPVSIRYRCFGS